MKLSIAMTVAGLVLRFSTPGPGSYLVWSQAEAGGAARVEASNHETNAVHAVFTIRPGEARRFYWVTFTGDAR